MTEFLGPTATGAIEGVVHPEVSVIIVTYGNETTIDACLHSLAAHTACPYEAVVVDNSPNDATWARIKAFCHERPGLALNAIRPGHNIGFAAGCNLGARHARGDFLLFLNPDTALDTDITAIFRSFWRDFPRAGLLGPRVCDASGRTVLTCRNLPNLWRFFWTPPDLTVWSAPTGCSISIMPRRAKSRSSSEPACSPPAGSSRT